MVTANTCPSNVIKTKIYMQQVLIFPQYFLHRGMQLINPRRVGGAVSVYKYVCFITFDTSSSLKFSE